MPNIHRPVVKIKYPFIVFDVLDYGIARPVTAKDMSRKERRFYQRQRRR